jgi:CRP/FNR family transcriptional regulator, cyclic AMP receptor protein
VSFRLASDRVTVGECFQEAIMNAVAFKAGDTIISEGDEGDTAFFIINGSVDVIIGHGAKARIVGKLNEGEVFGEMSLIEPGPRSATIRATTDVECLATSYEDFIAAIEDNPDRAVAFMKTLVRRLRQMNELIATVDPGKRGLRAMVHDWQKSVGPAERNPEVTALSWTMLW